MSNYEIKSQSLQMKELAFLANAFASSAATALHRGLHGDWIRLRELLEAVVPVASALFEFDEVKHYLHRLHQHLLRGSKECIDTRIKEALDFVFVMYKPEPLNELEQCRHTGVYLPSHKQNIVSIKGPEASNDDNDLFLLCWKEVEKKLNPQELKLSDLQYYLPRVVSEISRQESVWKNTLGLSLLVANTHLPDDIHPVTPSSYNSSKNTVESTAKKKSVHMTSPLPKTGIQVVEYLVRQESMNGTRIWFLNQNLKDSYNPYDLVVVSKNSVRPEHYVISIFGVLHVKLFGESELLSLGQWYREAVVFGTIRKINFFRTYGMCKAFMRWKKHAAFLKFLKVRKQIENSHLLCMPHMMSAILNVKSLLIEMQGLSLLPNDTRSCYTLTQFNLTVFEMLKDAKRYTVKLFSHCQSILWKVESYCQDYLNYCEVKVAQKTDNIKESMTVARQRRNKYTKNWNLAKYIEGKLPRFTRLIENMLHQFMLSFISENIEAFVSKMMQTENTERDGLFFTRFEFDPVSCFLVISPSSKELMESLNASFIKIPCMLEEACVDLKPTMNRFDTSNETDDDKQKHNVQELHVLLNCTNRNGTNRFKEGDRNSLKIADGIINELNCGEIRSPVCNFEKLKAGLDANILVKNCTALMESLMRSAFQEVDVFAMEHSWIADIHLFVKSWSHEVLQSWKGQSASKIEKQVQQIRDWIDQVQEIQQSLRTSNGILFVDSSHIQKILVPGLRTILSKLMDVTAMHCLVSSERLIQDLNAISKNLSLRASTIEEFALFYQNLCMLKEDSVQLKAREEYVKSIFEVVRHCYRQLTVHEEETEDKVIKGWNLFLYSLQDANNSVNELLPRMIENIDCKILSLETEAVEITEKVTSGKFLDAKENPAVILPELKNLHSRFIQVKEELLCLAKYKDIIEGKAYDLASILALHTRIVARYELWKYFEVTSFTIKDWMHTPFSKFQIRKVTEKLTKWRGAAAKLKNELPMNDVLLCSWIKTIEDFGQNLPLLQDLCSVSLKHRHWKWLFGGFGRVYDQSYMYIVADLIDFGLVDHSQLIVSICDSATAEYALESHLKKLVKHWEQEEFKLMKYHKVKQPVQRSDKSTREANKQILGFNGNSKGEQSQRDFLILTGVNELQCEVVSNLVTLQSMLASPHLAEMRGQVEAWLGYLHQLKEILDLWTTCQEKWLFLKKVFSHVSSSNPHVYQHLQEFLHVDSKYQEHILAVQKDPLVLSILEKKKGESGFRQLQGEVLREMLVILVTKEEQILKNLDSYLYAIRASFPRLYFMSNSEMFQVLAISRNPKALVPFVRKCFPGITNLKFALPSSVASTIRTQLDATLNDHRLEVVSLYGGLGEELSLSKPIKPHKSIEEWYYCIEVAMKCLMWKKMAQCIEERMVCNPSVCKLIKALGITRYDKEKEFAILNFVPSRKKLFADESQDAFWFMVYPFQCILAAEDFFWTHHMERILGSDPLESAADIRKIVDQSIQQCSTALQSYYIEDSGNCISRKVMMLIQNLLIRHMYHREATRDLFNEKLDKNSFQWLLSCRYSIDMSPGNENSLDGSTGTIKFGEMFINHMGFSVPYGYEYQEQATRLVITPITDRALLNLATSISLHHVGGLFGPTESGKTETIQEVAKIYGSHLVFFTCHPSMSLSKILQYLSGAVQSGTLLCFENANRLPSNILAVLGQHLDDIRQCLQILKRREFSEFEVRDLSLTEEVANGKSKRRERRATVISLHINDANDQFSPADEDETALRMKIEMRFNPRRHSFADIRNLKRKSTIKRKQSPDSIRCKSSEPFAGQLFDTSELVYDGAKPFGEILLGGALVVANPLYSCMLTLSTFDEEYPSIPNNLKSTTRMFGAMSLDFQVIIKVLLISHGFKTTDNLSKNILSFKEAFKSQLSGGALFTIHLSLLKKIITLAKIWLDEVKLKEISSHFDTSLELDSEGEIEEICIRKAIYSTIIASINSADHPHCRQLLEAFFPQSRGIAEDIVINNKDELLLSSVKQQIYSDSLYGKEDFISKVMQLYEILGLNTSVILLGDPGTGKSACYQTLCRSLCQFSSAWIQAVKERRIAMKESLRGNRQESFIFSKVHLSSFYHKGMTFEELYGGFDKIDDWSDGLLAKTIRTANQLNTQNDNSLYRKNSDEVQYWFVFDGPLEPGLLEPLESLLDSKNELLLANGERLKPSESMRFLFETSQLTYASPAMIARSAVVRFEENIVDWKCLFHSWKRNAQNRYRISISFKVIKAMLEHIIEPLNEFLSEETVQRLSSESSMKRKLVHCLTEISSILQLLGAFLDKFALIKESEKALSKKKVPSFHEADSPSLTNRVTKESEEVKFISNMFAFAFVWGVRGRLHESSYQAFDVFSRQLFATCPYPVIFPCPVFDCIFDHATNELIKWKFGEIEMPRAFPTNNYVITIEVEKYFTIADLLVSSGVNVLIIGDFGVGKTSFVKNLLQSRHRMQKIGFYQGLSPEIFQKTVKHYIEELENLYRTNTLKLSPLEKGSGSSRRILFLEDISMLSCNHGDQSAQPTLEVLREMMSEGRVFDHERKYFKHLPRLQFLATSVSNRQFGVGEAQKTLNPRLVRRMNCINMAALCKESLYSIYTSMFKTWLQEFPNYSLTHIEPLAKAMAHASVDIFNYVKDNFKESLANPQYLFSHYDLACIAKGVFLFSPRSKLAEKKPEKFRLEGSLATTKESIPNLSSSDCSPSQGNSLPGLHGNLTSGSTDHTSFSPLIRTIIRLWYHEVCRSLYDRMVCEKDKSMFSLMLNNVVAECFCGNIVDKSSSTPDLIVDPSNEGKMYKNTQVKFKDVESSRTAYHQSSFISYARLFGKKMTYPSDVIFSKHLSAGWSSGVYLDQERGYIECIEQDVEKALEKSLNIIRSADGSDFDLVLYREALFHAVKISRTLTLPGGHALLLSMNGHGRANTVRLVAALANIKIFHVSGAALNDQQKFRSVVKDACVAAGLHGKPVVLYIAENLSKEGLKDIAALLTFGNCPGLFTLDELVANGDHLLPGGIGYQRRTDNKSVAQERFTRRISSNLHIIFCAHFDSLKSIIDDFPCVISRVSCIDIYHEWTTNILERIAEKWLISKGQTGFFSRVLWDDRVKQLKAIYSTMARIHFSARMRLDVRRLGIEIFSPLKFIEFVDLFRFLCNTICSEKEAEFENMKKAIEKVEDCKHDIENAETNSNELIPTLTASRTVLITSEDNIYRAKKEYRESKIACCDQQEEIERLEGPLRLLRMELQEEFGLLSPMYDAAMDTLKSIGSHDIEEMRSYRDPPIGVKFVANMLCEMFDKPASWKEAKHLLMRDNLFQDLVFYDKEGISGGLLKKLEKFCISSDSDPENLVLISKAASSISIWLRAVYDYSCRLESFRPKQNKIKQIELELTTSKALLGERRAISHQKKADLESHIEVYRDIVKKTKNLEQQHQILKHIQYKAKSLLESMETHIKHWYSRIETLKEKLRTAPDNALLAAADTIYLAIFDEEVKEQLRNEWIGLCKTGFDVVNDTTKISVDQGYLINELFNTNDEQLKWIEKGSYLLTNASIARTCCIAGRRCWPFFLDPHNCAPSLVRFIEEELLSSLHTNGSTVGADSSEIDFPKSSFSEPRNGRIKADSTLTNTSEVQSNFMPVASVKDDTEVTPRSPHTGYPVNVQVIDADDILLDKKLKAAVAMGLPTLICHFERRAAGRFLDTLLTRNIIVKVDRGQFIVHENQWFNYHPNFRLYVSATVSMTYVKDHRFVLPLHRTFVINLAVDRKRLEALLTAYAVHSEKPELLSQKRSFEIDLVHFKKKRMTIQDDIREALCNIPDKILEDESLPNFISQSTSQMNVVQQQIEEIENFKMELDRKWHGYYEISSQSSFLYEIMQQVFHLEPYYEPSLQNFEEQFKMTLENCKRHKARSGSTSSLVNEITATFSLDLYKRICINIFKEHVPIYSLLVAAHQHKLEGKINEDHLSLFLKFCGLSDLICSMSPENDAFAQGWPTAEVISRIAGLDTLDGFNGLLHSFTASSSQWKEYFSMPLNLACSCPCGFQNLTIFHKALLWLAVVPSKHSFICHSLVANTLGPDFTKLFHHELTDILKLSSRNTPILIFLPPRSSLNQPEDPVSALQGLGKTIGIPVITTTLGTPELLKGAEKMIRNSFTKKTKNWVVLQNCHLETRWSQEFLRLIEDISDQRNETSQNEEHHLEEDTYFRIWFIFSCHKDLKIPFQVTKGSLQVAWDEKCFNNDISYACLSRDGWSVVGSLKSLSQQ